jgi:hypothetical protein
VVKQDFAGNKSPPDQIASAVVFNRNECTIEPEKVSLHGKARKSLGFSPCGALRVLPHPSQLFPDRSFRALTQVKKE